MARPPRCTVPEITQHVIQRGNNRGNLFVGERDYWVFRDCVAKAIDRYHCRIHAYVLMRNHVHFLMTPSVTGAIGKVMQSIGTQYVRYFNDRVSRTGTLWEGRYWARPIDTLRYLLTCYRYIELNPVRAGLVSEPGAFQWSSYPANAEGRRDALITPHFVYSALGRDEKSRLIAYRDLFRVDIAGDALAAIRPSHKLGQTLV